MTASSTRTLDTGTLCTSRHSFRNSLNTCLCVTIPNQKVELYNPCFPALETLVILFPPTLFPIVKNRDTPVTPVVITTTTLVIVSDAMASTYSLMPWILLLFSFFIVRAFLRRYWTPIKDIPGPLLASVSSLWQVLQIFKGHTEVEIIKLHRKHGRSSQELSNILSLKIICC